MSDLCTALTSTSEGSSSLWVLRTINLLSSRDFRSSSSFEHEILTSPQSAKRIIICACGTSWHAGLVGEYMLESLCKVPAAGPSLLPPPFLPSPPPSSPSLCP